MMTMLTLMLGLHLLGHAAPLPRPCAPPPAPTVWAGPPPAVAMATRTAAVCPWLASGISSPVVVRWYDGFGTTDSLARAARESAARTLDDAGVEVAWVDCGPAGVAGPCDAPLGHGELIVRVTGSKTAIGSQVLGDAYVPGVVATAYLDRIGQVAQRAGVPVDRVFGAVMAHEIGHLLFGDQHASRGVMRAVWSDRDLRATKQLRFADAPHDTHR